MMNYILMTDSDSDLPLSIKQEYDIPVVYMPYTLNGKEYYDDLGQSLDSASYYDAMRKGAAPSTSALNEANYIDYFEPILANGKDILFIAFSSQLSCTIQAMRAAAETLKETYPDRTIRIVDTLSISAPQTLLVIKAAQMYRDGKDMNEIGDWVEANKLRAHAWFVVDDLKYLARGGRISPAVAAIGNVLNLKPILTETREGKLDSAEKVRGRKKAMSYIVDKAVENVVDQKESVGIVLHGDAMEDAEKLKSMVLEKLPDMEIRIENVGPVIGAHAGPGTLAFCFMGKERAN